jgi:hypothetical protein
MTSIEERLRAANPVPNPEAAMDRSASAAVLAGVKQRVDRGRPGLLRPHLGLALWVAAAMLIVAFGVGLRWARGPEPLVVAAEPPTVRLALDYIDARNSHDIESALLVLSADARVAEFPVIRQLSELPAAFDYLDVVDEHLTVVTCAATGSDTVDCVYEMTNRLVDQAGADPIPGTMSFTVVDGRIEGIENWIDGDDFERTVFGPWVSWLHDHHEGGEHDLYRWLFQLDRVLPSPRLDRIASFGESLDRYTGVI